MVPKIIFRAHVCRNYSPLDILWKLHPAFLSTQHSYFKIVSSGNGEYPILAPTVNQRNHTIIVMPIASVHEIHFYRHLNVLFLIIYLIKGCNCCPFNCMLIFGSEVSSDSAQPASAIHYLAARLDMIIYCCATGVHVKTIPPEVSRALLSK